MFKESYKQANESISSNEFLIEKLLKKADKKKNKKIIFSSLITAFIIFCISFSTSSELTYKNNSSDISSAQATTDEYFGNINFSTALTLDYATAYEKKTKYRHDPRLIIEFRFPWHNPRSFLYK